MTDFQAPVVRRRQGIQTLAVIVLLGAFGSLQQTHAKNILLIIADDFGAESMDLYTNAPTAATPHINALAARGVQFTNCWSNPSCSPTRASILTGRHAFRTRVLGPGDAICLHEETVAGQLSEKGFATGCVGKWHLATQPQGFDYWRVLPGQGAYYNPFFLTLDFLLTTLFRSTLCCVLRWYRKVDVVDLYEKTFQHSLHLTLDLFSLLSK